MPHEALLKDGILLERNGQALHGIHTTVRDVALAVDDRVPSEKAVASAIENIYTNLDAITQTIIQASHGFTSSDIGKAITVNSSGNWLYANSNAEDTLAKSLIYDYIDVDSFRILIKGSIIQSTTQWDNIAGTTSGLTPGKTYVTKDDGTGELEEFDSLNPPSYAFFNYILFAYSTSGGYILEQKSTNNTYDYSRVTPPDSDLSPGQPGQWAFDGSYSYKCVAINEWTKQKEITNF